MARFRSRRRSFGRRSFSRVGRRSRRKNRFLNTYRVARGGIRL